MARLVSVIGFPHNPLIYVITRPDLSAWAPEVAAFVRRASEIRADLERVRPDVTSLSGTTTCTISS